MEYPDQIDASIELQAETEADKKVSKLFKDSKIDDWLAENRGSTYTRIQLELKLAAQRMFKYEYLMLYHRAQIYIIETKRDSLSSEIGKLKASLYIWQIKDEWLHQYSQNKEFNDRKFNWREFRQRIIQALTTLLGILFSLVELILKSGLAFIVIISLLGITGVMPRDGNFSEVLEDQSKLIPVIATTFAGISLIHFLSTYIYYDFLFYKKDLGQSGRGFFRRLVRRRLYKRPNPPSFPLLARILSFFSVNPQISGRTVKVLDWQITQREIFMLFIFLAETLLGYEGIIRLAKAPLNNGDLVTPEFWDHLAIGLSSGIYALVNMAFSVAKAKRSAAILPKYEQYLALVERKKSMILAIQESLAKVSQFDDEYKIYKKEYETLLHETGGILAQIELLSIDAYENARGTIPESSDIDLRGRHES